MKTIGLKRARRLSPDSPSQAPPTSFRDKQKLRQAGGISIYQGTTRKRIARMACWEVENLYFLPCCPWVAFYKYGIGSRRDAHQINAIDAISNDEHVTILGLARPRHVYLEEAMTTFMLE